MQWTRHRLLTGNLARFRPLCGRGRLLCTRLPEPSSLLTLRFAGGLVCAAACPKAYNVLCLEAQAECKEDLHEAVASPVSFELRSIDDFLRLVGRALWLSISMLPPLLLALPAYLLPDHFLPWFQAAALRSLERSGPCMIKLGQWASTRNDIFSPMFCSVLSKLHDNAPAHSIYHTRKAIEVCVQPESCARQQIILRLGERCLAIPPHSPR